MNREELLKKFTALLDEFQRQRSFGSIEIIFRLGEPSVIHKLTTEKFSERETTHHERPRY